MLTLLNEVNIISVIRISIVSAILIVFMVIKNVHIMQLNSYNLDQQIIWYKKNKSIYLINLTLFISIVFFYKLKVSIFFLLLVISMLSLFIESLPRKAKKKLVYTSRIKRLIFINIILVIPFFVKAFLTKRYVDTFYTLLAVAISPLITFIAYLFALPIENAFRRKFMNEAKNVVDDNKNLKVVGITGSYGKTSVKFYLNHLLSSKHTVCMTPESFNTAMGATLTIKNDLKSFDDYFICEMGARRVGDIKEICDIVSPSSCIITDVGPMHLDTFKNIENVKKCKFELLDSVCESEKNDKVAIINGNNPIMIETIKKYKAENKLNNVKVYTYGFNDNCDFKASNIKVSSDGSLFDFINEDKCINIETKLLGKHNIMNLMAAISFAIISGIDMDDIVKEVKSIESVEHRLKLLSYDKENLIIDDAYNSNPVGARNSADTLKLFDGYVRVMITPGMVELSDKQYIENETFAEYAADKIDYALVVAKTNREALKKGFLSKLSEDRVICFDKIDEAYFYARYNIKGKKVILLENDLSDNY